MSDSLAWLRSVIEDRRCGERYREDFNIEMNWHCEKIMAVLEAAEEYLWVGDEDEQIDAFEAMREALAALKAARPDYVPLQGTKTSEGKE